MARHRREFGSINIGHPKGTEDVNTDMGLNVVAGSGDCAPDAGFLLEFVYGVVFQGSTAPGMQDSQSGEVIDPAVGSFHFPSGLYGADCNSGGTAPNSVKYWCVFRETATTHEVTTDLTGTFNGHCVSSVARSRSAARVFPGFPLAYSQKIGKQRRYRNAAVTHPHEGSILLDGAKPLFATSISVVARNVLWRSKDTRGNAYIEINRARGQAQLAPNSDTWRFDGLNKFAIVVWQLGGIEKVVRSESQANPTLITGLNNTRPIFVQVNDLARKYSDNFGAFDLLVRIESV
jgi:hypothetical protein